MANSAVTRCQLEVESSMEKKKLTSVNIFADFASLRNK